MGIQISIIQIHLNSAFLARRSHIGISSRQSVGRQTIIWISRTVVHGRKSDDLSIRRTTDTEYELCYAPVRAFINSRPNGLSRLRHGRAVRYDCGTG